MTNDWKGYTLEELYEEKAKDEIVVFLRFLTDDIDTIVDLANTFEIDFTDAMTDFVFTRDYDSEEEAVKFVELFDEGNVYEDCYEYVAVLAVKNGKTIKSNNRDVVPYILKRVFEKSDLASEEE